MTAEQQAHDFFLGIREALHCPYVSVTEYEGVIAHRLRERDQKLRETVATWIEHQNATLNEMFSELNGRHDAFTRDLAEALRNPQISLE